MAVYTVDVKSIGTAIRDFATITLWEATVSGNINKGQIGEVFADSDFDERPILSNAAPTDPASTRPILRAAAGQRPVIKPTTNGDVLIVTSVRIHGLTIDGTNQTSGIGIKITTGGGTFVSECEVKNCAGDGIKSTIRTTILLCLAHNNGGNGIFTTGGGSAVICCGAAKNGGIGLRHDSAFCDYRSCWSLDNTGDDVKDPEPSDTRFMYISDTSITDSGTMSFPDDIFENQTSGSLGFTNFAGNDFTLAAGSTLRRMGGLYNQRFLTSSTFSEHPQIRFDVAGSSLVPQFGDRFDVGPHQPSIQQVSVAIPGAPTLDSVTAGDGQATANVTAANEANTVEVFFWIVGSATATSGGTRTGSGTIPITGLVNNTQYRFVALEKNTDGCYGPPSTSRTATPNDGTSTDIEAVMFDHLKTQAVITAQVGTRIFTDIAPQGTAFPYITLHYISDPGEHHVGGASKLALPTMQVDVWAKTSPDRKAAANAVRDTLDTLSRVKKGGLFIMNARLTDQRDDYIEPGDGEEVGVFRKSMDFLIHYDRPVPTG